MARSPGWQKRIVGRGQIGDGRRHILGDDAWLRLLVPPQCLVCDLRDVTPDAVKAADESAVAVVYPAGVPESCPTAPRRTASAAPATGRGILATLSWARCRQSDSSG